MNPTEAVETLIESGWKQAQIAAEIGTSSPTLTRIKEGKIKVEWTMGQALIDLAKREKRRSARRSTA